MFNLLTKIHKHVMCYYSICLGRKQVNPQMKKNYESRSRLLSNSLVNRRYKRYQSDSNLLNVSTQEQLSSWETNNSTKRINNESDIDFVDDLPSISPLSKWLTKGKFKEPLPNLEFEDNSQDDTSSSDPNKEQSEEGVSSNNQDNMPIFNFNLLQINLEIFDDPI